MGRAWTFGDDIDTDVITPTEYLHDKDLYVNHAMEPVDPDFADSVAEGDVVVAGRNFGCGSSRETAANVFVELGVDGVVAVSFARIFYRNAINIGLPVYICPEAVAGTDAGDQIEIDHDDAAIINRSTDDRYQAEDQPEFIQEIIRHGGLPGYRESLHE